MKTAVLVKPGKIEIRETDAPIPGPSEVLIKVIRIGVCGSDIHAFKGKHPYVTYPFIQGHEFSGEVAGFGKKVSGLKKGDKVTAMPQLVCGKCYACTHGQYNICDSLKVLGFQADGAARHYFSVDKNLVIRIPQDVEFDAGAMVEPVAVGVHAVQRAGKIKGKKVLVLGAGPIGNLTAQAAKSLGAFDVIITDVIDSRLEKAQECGIRTAINVRKENIADRVFFVFGPDRADLIIECVGGEATISQAIEIARKGSSIIIVGVFGDKPKVDMGLIQDRELTITGTLMYMKKDYITALSLLKAKAIKTQPLVTDHFPFAGYQKAYEYIEKNREKTMKVMIDVD